MANVKRCKSAESRMHIKIALGAAAASCQTRRSNSMVMLQSDMLTLTLTVTLLVSLSSYQLCALAAPLEVVYTGESCACPKQLGYQLSVPSPPKAQQYEPANYGYRVEQPKPSKTKIRYSFDFTVEEPRTAAPPKQQLAELYAKVDRIALNKADCLPQPTASCSCGDCDSCNKKPRYVDRQPRSCKCQKPQCKCNNSARQALLAHLAFVPLPMSAAIRDSTSPSPDSSNAITRHKRDLHSRKRQLPAERATRPVKLYHKDLTAQKLGLLSLAPMSEEESPKCKRKTKKTPTVLAAHADSAEPRPLLRWLQKQRRLVKRDIKGEYDQLERERDNLDLTLPDIVQYMPETLNPNFRRGQCHMGSGCADATPEAHNRIAESHSTTPGEADETDEAAVVTEAAQSESTAQAKRQAAVGGYPQQIPSPLYGYADSPAGYRFVDETYLRPLLSTTSVPDPLEPSSTPMQFAGDLDSPPGYTGTSVAPLLSAKYDEQSDPRAPQYPLEHLDDAKLDRIIAGIVYRHPAFLEATKRYRSSLVEPEPLQKKHTTEFLKKLIDRRLGGWGFDPNVEQDASAGYVNVPPQSDDYERLSNHGYSVDSFNVQPMQDYLRAWF